MLVYPSLYEGFGLPLLEAMVHDCPVVASHIAILSEVAGPAARFFDPDDDASAQAAVREVLENSQVRARLKRQGHQRIQSFSWQKTACQTLDVYRVVQGSY